MVTTPRSSVITVIGAPTAGVSVTFAVGMPALVWSITIRRSCASPRLGDVGTWAPGAGVTGAPGAGVTGAAGAGAGAGDCANTGDVASDAKSTRSTRNTRFIW